MRPVTRLAAAATAALLLTSCGSSNNDSGGTPSQGAGSSTSASSAPTEAGSQIAIAGFAFTTPASVTPGQTLTLTNSDSVEHTVTSDDGTSFDVTVAAGGTATLTAPTKPGTYAFHCTIHPDMHGSLVVAP